MLKNPAYRRAVLIFLLYAAAFLLPAGAVQAALPGSPGKAKAASRAPRLAAFQTLITTGNRIEFNMSNNGYLAVDPNRGAVTPGGFWPSGSEDAYIFQVGLHVMGIIDSDGDGIATDIVETNQVFDSEWREGRPGDTPDDPESRLYFSTSERDLGEWPEEFVVPDQNPNSPTFGQSVPDVKSEQDIVSIYTDIDGPLNTAAGTLRLGVEVRQHVLFYSLRDLQDVMFVIWDVYNASAFIQDPNVVPGYDIHEAFVNIKNDFDIGENALDDRCAVSPVRNMSIAFDSDFSETGFSGPPAFMGTSFLAGPTDSDGIDNPNSLFPAGNGLTDETFGDIVEAGTKDPRTGLFFEFDQDVLNESAERMSLFTINTNGGERPDPQDDTEAYRILSGDPNEVHIPPYDPYANLIVADIVGDLRQNIVSGPFELPNTNLQEHQRVVAAFYFARPLTSAVDLNNLTVEGEFKPIISLWQVAKVAYENGFIVPSPPPSPAMRLVPGDRQVTITWDDTPVEVTDPYSLTGAAASLLPVPDFPGLAYRAKDFEGFRVYRSLTGNADDAKLIAQFDLDNEFKTYKITGAVKTGQGLEDLVEEIPLGSNTGLAFSLTDRGEDIGALINGVPVFYTVTSYDFNPVLVGDESLETSINFRHQDAEGRFFQMAIPRTSSTSIVSGSGSWKQVDYFGQEVVPNLPAIWEIVGNVGDNTYRGAVVDFISPIPPTTGAFAEELSQVVVIDPENAPLLGGYLVVDSIEHTDKDTRNHIHYAHFEDPEGRSTTKGTFTIPYHEIEGLYPVDEVNEQTEPFNFSGPLVSDGPAFNGSAYFKQGGLEAAKIAPLKVKHSGSGSYLESLSIDPGSYEMTGSVVYEDFTVNQPFIPYQMNGFISRTVNVAGQFTPGSLVIRWLDDGSVEVWDQANNVPVRFNEQVADGWGFLPLDRFSYEELYQDQIERPRAKRSTRLVPQAVFVPDPENSGSERMSLYVRGVELHLQNIARRPQAGDEWTLDMAFITQLSQTLHYTSPFAGMRMALYLSPATKSTAGGRLNKVKVVPNPYIASSLFDSGPNKRSIMFTNLPLRATIRIYTVSGNLVNVLHHGPGEEGSLGGTGDRNSGQYSFDLSTRFGDQMASGIYYFHVRDDETGEVTLGKFSIIQ
ncbi:MAG TPA: hypothetical protein VM123_18470 [archaeon]|nr:hypothetical protein [archaeon]